MSGFLLPDEELRMRTGSSVRSEAPPANDFLLPGEQVATDRAAPVVRQAVAVDPDKAGKTRSIARAAGVPEPFVERNFEQVQREEKLRDIAEVMRTSPVLARQLTDPAFAKVAHDDVLNLSSVAGVLARPSGPERAVTSDEFTQMVVETRQKNPGMDWDQARASVNSRVVVDNSPGGIRASERPVPSFSTLAAGLRSGFMEGGVEQVVQGARQWLGDLFGFDTVSADAARKGAQSRNRQFLETPKVDGVAGDVYGGVGSTLQMIPGLAASLLTGNPALGLAILGGQSAAPAYSKYRARGGTKGEASTGAVLEGGAEVLGELLPMGFLVNNLGRVGMTKFVTGLLGREIPSEIGTTLAQTAVDTAIANPTKTWGDWASELPEEIRSTVIGTVTQAGLFAGAHAGIRKLDLAARTADNDAEALANLLKLAEASKVRERDPQSFQQFVDEAANDGPVQSIFVPAAVFAQAAGDNLAVFMQAMPSVKDQMDEALLSNSDLVIPVGEFAANVPGTGMEKTLIENARTSIEGMSQVEAKTFMQEAVQQFQAQAEEIAAQSEFTDAIKQSAATVENELFTQLETAARFTKDVNTAYAMLASSFYAVQAQRLGITPEEMYVRYPLQIRAGGVPGDRVFDQSGDGKGQDPAYNLNQNGKDPYTLDLFRVPADAGKNQPAGGSSQGRRAGNLSRNDAPGTFATRTEVVKENTRQLGAVKVTSPEEAAQALAYLGRNAVEHFDALVTDKDGNPLAIVGSFKGAVAQTSVYPATIASEAFRIEGAANIWLAHNHPSGSNEFSPADRNMHAQLRKVFEGSGIKLHGLFAIAAKEGSGRKWVFEPTASAEGGTYGLDDLKGTTTNAAATSSVPVVERVYAEEGAIGPAVQTPSDAKEGAKILSGGESGVILMSYQHVPVAFVPIDPTEGGQLRRSGRMDALYRALSLSNAGTAIIVNNGALGQDVVRNVAGLFNSLDTRVLDVVDISSKTPMSWAEAGMAFDNKTFRQQGSARGQIGFAETMAQPSVMTLLQHADLSTFLHEMGHFQLEVLADIASQPNAPAEVVADMDKLLAWFGVKDLATWQAMSTEEKRPHHEQLARGFEAYLFEGNAPSVELRGVFARFRAWMINVYRQLKELNVTLTDEVRGVFDRLVATNEQIIEAEAERSYAPLFKSAEEMGATPAEWAAYQALGQDATQEAVDLLQTRSLRNMAYATNARSRVIRELQKDAEVKRREIRIEARREILSDPVYQAWQFLSRRLGPDDKLPPERTRSNPDVVDEFSDSLFAAIAKLGGLNREKVVSTWGTDPADKPASGLFGKPVWRKTGGRTLDDMAEALGQYGYFTLDEHGKIDLAEFEEKFAAELRGESQYSAYYDYARDNARPGDQVVNPMGLMAGRFDAFSLRELQIPEDVIARLQDLRMVAKDGLHPDIVASMFGLSSGDELARKLADTEPPGAAIEGLTDQRMLERYGDMTDEKSIGRAADAAIHNDVRARFIAAELRALAKATGNPKIFTKAAKAFADQLIARKRVRDIRPAQYAAAEKRAAKAALAALQPVAPSDPDPVTKAMRNPGRKGGNLVEAATEKRNQLVNYYAAKAAHEALAEVDRAVRYLKKFDSDATRKAINIEHMDQIDAILERFDLRQITNRAADKRASLAAWISAQEEAGIEPAIPDEIRNEAFRKPFKEMTLEEVRGVVDSVKNIEHIGRRWKELFTARDKREFDAVVADMADSIRANATGTVPERRSSDRGFLVAAGKLFRGFFAAHRKFASLAREMDGWTDGGVLWERLVWGMNDAGNAEAVAREQATIKLGELLKPVLAGGNLAEKRYFPSAGKAFTREERIGILLNMGNEVNQERIVTGERLTPAALRDIFATLTPADAAFAQGVWDYLDTFRPQIAAKERRLTGLEPEWVDPKPFQVTLADGNTVTLAGGYYPIKYDPLRSERSQADTAAEVQRQLERGLYTRAQTRRGHTKARVESTGRALRLDFGNVLAGHVDQVVHDLAWHEYLIDANRLLRAGAVEHAIREHYGVDKLQEMKKTLTDIAVGDLAAQSSLDHVLNHLRHGATVAGLGWRVTTSLLQPLGLTQSIVRIGAKNVLRGAFHWAGDAAALTNSNRLIGEKSDFMRLRAKTLQREINEIRNKVAGGDSKIEASYFYLIQKMQLVADIPTWWGQYEAAMRQADMTEEKAVALADQAVRDAQGSGQIGDLAGIQRGHAGLKLFTNFYSFFNTTYNMTREAVGRTDFKKPGDVALLAVDMLLLYTVPAILGTLMKATLAGDWDDEEKLARRLAADQLNYLLGTVVLLREAGSAMQAALGLTGDYGGPASVRFFSDLAKLAKQTNQGDADEAFWKSLNNVGGALFHYPSGQINATIDGLNAVGTGKTDNPGALLVGSNRN